MIEGKGRRERKEEVSKLLPNTDTAVTDR